MTKLLLILASIAIPPAFAFAGMVLLLLANPDADIETQGWVLGWTGMGFGFLAGVLGVWAFWRARRRAQLLTALR